MIIIAVTLIVHKIKKSKKQTGKITKTELFRNVKNKKVDHRRKA